MTDEQLLGAPRDDQRSVRRRQLLAALGAAGLSGGCLERVESVIGQSSHDVITLTIKTLPADADENATRIARTLASRLQQVGVNARVVPLAREELWRDVLLNHEFDMYVGQFPARRDPDFLRGLLHSRFAPAPGWTNPFGYANLAMDEKLEKQRRQSGRQRRATVNDVQTLIAREQPFSVLAFPDQIRAYRDPRITDWGTDGLRHPRGYFSVDLDDSVSGTTANETAIADRTSTPSSTAGSDAGGTATTEASNPATDSDATNATTTPGAAGGRVFRATTTDARVTENLNPLNVEFRTRGFVTALVYDRLGRRIDGRVRPWLAEDWEWTGEDDTPVAHVRLREGSRWHDGVPITADDVAFTYRFMRDTSLGSLSPPVPSPNFRDRFSLVTDVEEVDSETVRMEFRDVAPDVAARAFQIPVLPAHIWADRTDPVTIAGIDTGSKVTQAIGTSNTSPVGSGPFEVRSVTYKKSVVLEPFDDHFLTTETLTSLPERYTSPQEFDRLEFLSVPSSAAAVTLLQRGDADATATSVAPEDVPTIGRSKSLNLQATRSRSFYHVGYNHRRSPLGSPRFRRAIARLLDEDHLVRSVFDGYARPAASPLAGTDWLAPSLRWTDSDPSVPFAGTNGRLDKSKARNAFSEAGYQYTADGRLVTG